MPGILASHCDLHCVLRYEKAKHLPAVDFPVILVNVVLFKGEFSPVMNEFVSQYSFSSFYLLWGTYSISALSYLAVPNFTQIT